MYLLYLVTNNKEFKMTEMIAMLILLLVSSVVLFGTVYSIYNDYDYINPNDTFGMFIIVGIVNIFIPAHLFSDVNVIITGIHISNIYSICMILAVLIDIIIGATWYMGLRDLEEPLSIVETLFMFLFSAGFLLPAGIGLAHAEISSIAYFADPSSSIIGMWSLLYIPLIGFSCGLIIYSVICGLFPKFRKKLLSLIS